MQPYHRGYVYPDDTHQHLEKWQATNPVISVGCALSDLATIWGVLYINARLAAQLPL